MKSFIKIDELKENIPEPVFSQLRHILSESSLPDNEESLLRIMEAWLTKQALFDKLIDHYNLKKANSLSRNSPCACIAITLSGSIIALGPLIEGFRLLDYASIRMRTDVPPAINANEVVCEADIELNKSISFTKGPIKKTSPIIDIGTFGEEVGTDKQLFMIKEIKNELLDYFIKINKTIIHTKSNDQDNINNRNDLFYKWIIIEWFVLGGLEKHIFLARAKLLWLELFTSVYAALIEKSNRDELFIEFTNVKFGQFIDEYKWYESEKKDFDIGLMKALEEIPGDDSYKKFEAGYIGSIS